jgi:membrane fusion protein, epimerase transport system
MRHKLRGFFDGVRQWVFGIEPENADSGASDILDSDRQARRFGYIIVLVVFGGFGIWAAVAPLESAAHGTGTVQVEGHRKLVQHFEGGMVAEILVANGDYVTEGQPLIRMDSTQTVAELSIVAGRLWAKRALVDRLLSERDALSAISFTDWLVALSDERARVAADNERTLFVARQADLNGEIGVLEQRIEQMNKQIEGTYAVLQAKRSVAQSLASEATELQELLAEGYVDKQRIRELERSRASILGEISDLVARVAGVEVSIEETKLQILQLEKRFKTQIVDALTRAEEELYDLQQQHLAINDKVERTVVRAPSSGIVLALEPNTIGAVVGSGDQLMAIVPDAKNLLIDTKLSPMDIDRIRIGQEAEVRFAVFKDAYSITGVLTKVSPDSLIDKMTGAPYFEAKVELLKEDMKLLGEYRLMPGMPATVLVKTGNRTLLGYLTSPLHRMFEASLLDA